MSLKEILEASRVASTELLNCDEAKKNKILKAMRNAIDENRKKILDANTLDVKAAKEKGMSNSLLDRLTLTDSRIDSILKGIDEIIELDDPIGRVLDERIASSGIKIKKVSVPFGVIGAIFEARPNVSPDIASLTIKASSACVLKGGSDCLKTNIAIVDSMREGIRNLINPNVITLIESTSRDITLELIKSKGLIDLVIPRGGKGLISFVTENAKVPFIETGSGNCHLYVHEKADFDMAIKVAINAKYQRPSVCNAIENILVDRSVATEFLPILYNEFKKLDIEMRGTDEVRKIIPCNIATEDDFYTEYNDYIVSIKIVDSINEAIEHINTHSSKHSEAIITEDLDARDLFFSLIDSACVYHNASTRFTDGGEFMMGAEIGISTSKLHARGPMGLNEITTYKYLIMGNGEIRK